MSLDRIAGCGNLYIGGLISLRRYKALKNASITHVVSALRQPLDKDLVAPYKHLVVELDDVDDEDILQHFATSNEFIREGLEGGGGVLVHCAMGKSRSATLVVSYMMSKSPSTTPEQALDIIRDSRPIVEPNPGFMDQLGLYHSMGCPQDVTVEPAYQRWLYQREVEMSVACGRAPDTIRFEDEVSSSADPSPQTPHPEVELRCRRCRRSLARSPYILGHVPEAPSATQAAQAGPITSIDNETAGTAAAPQCAHVFLDPLSWMRPELEQGKLDGKLNCPKCSSIVGKYAWQGMRCSCRLWVTPAISLAKGRIDEVKLRAKPTAGNQNGKI